MINIKLTESQRDMVVLALNNEVWGEDPKDSYDLKLKRLIKKFKEA